MASTALKMTFTTRQRLGSSLVGSWHGILAQKLLLEADWPLLPFPPLSIFSSCAEKHQSES